MSGANHNPYDRQWRMRREQQLRAHPLCRVCLDVFGRVTQAVVADHVEPHRGDPVKFRGPLQSLCAECHSGWKQELERTGHVRGCDLNGTPLDPSHPWRIEADKGGRSSS